MSGNRSTATRVGAGIAAGIATLGAGTAAYAARNLTYDTREAARLASSGMRARAVTTPDGAVITYGEGPARGAPLLLIHGQQVSWADYASVLGTLTRDWHVFAVDAFGHGGSEKDPSRYPALPQTEALAWFVENVVGAPVVVAGHSSGGLLAVRLAADFADRVRAVLIEDAPFFGTEPERARSTYAWLDTFRNIHRYLEAGASAGADSWTRYWLQHSYLRTMFGDRAWQSLVRGPVERRLDRDPRVVPKLWWLPPTLNRAIALTACLQDGTGDYDLRYGEMFYDGSWLAGFDQAETLGRVLVPATLLHTTTHDQDGVLLGAMTSDDANRAHTLMPDCLLVDNIPSGHDIHRQQPSLYLDALNALRDRIRG
ncbi:alpha/beta hydrolase [Gordonia paraffinivorans]|uniref:alpha/beta fold hydrolase n=1 Tax=Gordonia paraffinivorans TaxID=175628 RepID=UPI000D620EC6|nr:alpha/beta hydrolase [Gordonia paraffinivorans]MBY4574722.1 alpha/beta hydrolase [Gordonia paraffinivorans]PWD45082.1 alpha/beta hydrolase [Gordonia paraffinivorans]